MPKFSKHDLVFAKVKGYPAWPAIVTDYKNKKYHVKFYGTGERGSIKEEDLRYYLESKDQLAGKLSHIKRKDYLDALAEIEKAFRKAKTDGNESNDSEKESLKVEKPETSRKLIVKRKSTIESENTPTAKRIGGKRKTYTSETSNDNETNDNEKVQEKVKEEQIETVKVETSMENDLKNRGGRKKAKELSVDAEVDPSTPEKTKALKNTTKKSIQRKSAFNIEDESSSDSDIVYTVVPVDNLELLVKYFDIVKKKPEPFKKRAAEDLPPPSEKTQVVRSVVPEDATFLGISYHEKRMPKFNNEYDRAAYEAKEAHRVIQLKNDIETGAKSVDEVSSFCVPLDGKNTEVERNSILEDWLCQKTKKLQYLKIENELLKCDCGVKNALGLDKANPKLALEHLNTMKSLPVEPLMLKKHPQVFEIIKRLQRYVGNIHEWDMEKEEADKFREDAKEVRVQADQVFDKFYTLMLKVLPSRDQINDTIFWTKYMEEIERFQRETSHMKESEVFVMSAEQGSRASILDKLCQDIMSGKLVEETKTAVPDSTSAALRRSSNAANEADSSAIVAEETIETK